MSAAAHSPLWRDRDYMLLWSGQMVSVLGSRVSQFSLPLLILALTHSPAQAGTVTALLGLPYLIVGLPAGVLVDRWDRKRTMIVCSAVNCLGMGTVPVALWVGGLPMPQLYAVALLTGTAFVFFDVAEIAALPNVVREDQLPAAIGQNQATFSVGGVIGQPLGGVLFQLARSLPFLVDALSYAVSVLSLLAVRAPFEAERLATRRSLGADLREGITWLWRHPSMRGLTLLTAASNLLTAGFPLLIIMLALGAIPIRAAVGGVLLQVAGVTAMVWARAGGRAGLALAATVKSRIRTVPSVEEPGWYRKNISQ